MAYFTVSIVSKPKTSRSDIGFEISVKIYPEIRSPYVVLLLFSGVTATCENSKFPKSGGLAFLTTSLYHFHRHYCLKSSDSGLSNCVTQKFKNQDFEYILPNVNQILWSVAYDVEGVHIKISASNRSKKLERSSFETGYA